MVAGSSIITETYCGSCYGAAATNRGAMALPGSWLASFPDDVVEEILTRLPPKPLVRFRCVSRGWNSNIADPEFIGKHLTVNKAKSLADCYNNDNNNVGYLLWEEDRMPRRGELFSSESDLCTAVCNTDGSLTAISREIIPRFFCISGFCNGIFYYIDHPMTKRKAPRPGYYPVRNPEISLWNPSIRKYKRLPHVLNDDCFETCAYQLAFPTSQNNDLKFLVFGRFIERRVPSKKRGAQVYTLSTDSWSWVELQVDSLDIGSVGPITGIAKWSYLFYNGALHSIAKFILCFNIDDEELPFREIKLPRNYSNGLTIEFEQLVVFKGSLALIAFGQDEAEFKEVCRIWVMSKYGLVDSSWTQRCSVPLSGVEDFLGCTGSGELMIKKLGNQVFLFDPENQNEKDLGIQNLTRVEDLYTLVFTTNLIESLVLLNE